MQKIKDINTYDEVGKVKYKESLVSINKIIKDAKNKESRCEMKTKKQFIRIGLISLILIIVTGMLNISYGAGLVDTLKK